MMKRLYTLSLLALLLLPCLVCSQDQPTGNNIFIPKLRGEITLDGRLNDWQGVQPLTMASENLVRGGQWQGRLDLSLTAWLSWDEQGLYFAADLVEDSFAGVKSRGQIWNSDCVIITLQLPADEAEGKQYYLIFSMKNSMPVASLLYGKGAVFSLKRADSLVVKAREREGYAPVFEGFIGWQDLNSSGGKESPARINFNLEARDVEKRGSMKSISWIPSEQQVGSGLKLALAALTNRNTSIKSEENQRREASFYGSVHLVQIPVSVVDQEGNFIKGLGPGDFELLEDGQVQEIKEVNLETRPFTVGLVMDSSGSMKPYISAAKNAAKTFLENIRPEDRVFVVAFSESIELLKDFEGGVEETKEAIDEIRPKGSTMLYAGLYFSLEKVKYLREKKVIILLSDGKDESMGLRNPYGHDLSMKLISEEAKRNETSVYAIAFRLSDAIAETELTELVEETGGRMFSAGDTEGLIEAYDKIAQELKSQYVISYVSTNHNNDGAWREIKVNVKNQDYDLRTRKGYYAPRR